MRRNASPAVPSGRKLPVGTIGRLERQGSACGQGFGPLLVGGLVTKCLPGTPASPTKAQGKPLQHPMCPLWDTPQLLPGGKGAPGRLEAATWQGDHIQPQCLWCPPQAWIGSPSGNPNGPAVPCSERHTMQPTGLSTFPALTARSSTPRRRKMWSR